MDTLANREDPDEMQHYAAFHQSLHCLLKLKQPLGAEKHHTLEMSTVDCLEYTTGSPHTYCINMYGNITRIQRLNNYYYYPTVCIRSSCLVYAIS